MSRGRNRAWPLCRAGSASRGTAVGRATAAPRSSARTATWSRFASRPDARVVATAGQEQEDGGPAEDDREDGARRVEGLDAFQAEDGEIRGPDDGDRAEAREPGEDRGGRRVGDDAERGLEAGASMEEMLRDQDEDGGGEDGADDLPDDHPHEPVDAPADDHVTRAVERRADREERERRRQPADLAH